MGSQSSSTLKNDASCVEVYNLSLLKAKYPDFPMPAGERGPFAIWQEGTAPGDTTFTAAEFLLTREGKWLPLYAFITMDVEERRALCLYNTAAEALERIEHLTGIAEVDVARIAKSKGNG